ncbi:MAG: diaminopimelate decarboxylase [Alphaproteobacteria bacterium]|nr:diaminopimelate decarboxylase [Alphaproteobacteria bacterium]
MNPSGFVLRRGRWHCEGVDLERIAREVGTPVYVYSSGALVARYRRFRAAVARFGRRTLVCYALKANSNQAAIATLARAGAGADVVSGGELQRALAAGVPPERIVFSGVGKTRAELEYALRVGIHQLNLESAEELELLSRVVSAQRRTATVALRVNPDIDAGTHAKITTGTKANKFGIAIGEAPELFARAAGLRYVRALGVAVHIGSQIDRLAPFERAFGRIARLVRDLRAAGHGVKRADLGGGLGVRYDRETPPGPEAYAAMVERALGGLGLDLAFEPGRWMVAEAGVLLTRVIYDKRGRHKRFVVVDAAMNDLMRPAIYDAYHPIEPVRMPDKGTAASRADVVGPICESSDWLGKGRQLPALAENDLLCIFGAGAYGAVMASSYNTRAIAPEVLVRGRDFAVTRPRFETAALIRRERLPDWLA